MSEFDLLGEIFVSSLKSLFDLRATETGEVRVDPAEPERFSASDETQSLVLAGDPFQTSCLVSTVVTLSPAGNQWQSLRQTLILFSQQEQKKRK